MKENTTPFLLPFQLKYTEILPFEEGIYKAKTRACPPQGLEIEHKKE